MSEGETDTGGSRRTNQNNSVTPPSPGNSAGPDRELPTIEDRVSEFYEEYPELAHLPLTTTHGETLRREYTWEEWSEWTAAAPRDQDDEVSGHDLDRRCAVTWGEAVERTLENHEETRKTTINLELGYPSDPEYAEFSIDADNRWFSCYQKQYFAQMKGWLRENIGGERPSGGVSEPDMQEPRIALLTLSASSVPDNERVGPVRHTKVRRSSWSDGCYDTLRNQMRRLGYEWQYDRRSEPHAGKRGSKGINTCYGHDHIILLVDGAVTPNDLRPIVEKHVEECDWAGPQAHDLHIEDWDANRNDVDTVTIREPDDLDDPARYLADYCAIEPTDLMERQIEYVAWAAAVNAANTKTISRSDSAKWAATADACKQQFESDQSDQVVDHGEKVRRSNRRGVEIECSNCGSPYGIDQDQTLTAARSSSSDGPAVADGGIDREQELLDAWPSARAVGGVGQSRERLRWRKKLEEHARVNDLDYEDLYDATILGELGLPSEAREVVDELVAGVDPSEPVSAERVPEWRVTSVTIEEEEYPASAGNGVDLVETIDPVERLLSETVLGNDGAEKTYWRCKRTNVAMHRGRSMAHYLVKHGIVHPEPAEACITAVRGPLAEADRTTI